MNYLLLLFIWLGVCIVLAPPVGLWLRRKARQQTVDRRQETGNRRQGVRLVGGDSNSDRGTRRLV